MKSVPCIMHIHPCDSSVLVVSNIKIHNFYYIWYLLSTEQHIQLMTHFLMAHAMEQIV